ncbi:MAG: hypothetical protein U9Q72_03200 [Patescibacteria group bacterium]|nr:hypothetical protein [Patescibacteria group bacterium]
MQPKWFSIKDIPFDQMWDDDKYWLPHVLAGKKLKGKFIFGKEDKVTDKVLKFVGKLK